MDAVIIATRQELMSLRSGEILSELTRNEKHP